MIITDPNLLWYIIFILLITVICLAATTAVYFLKYKNLLRTVHPAIKVEKKIIPMTARIAGRCGICIKRIEEGDLMIVCISCRKTYHLSCAAHIGICPSCGKNIQPESVETKPSLQKVPVVQTRERVEQKEILMPVKVGATQRCSGCARVIDIDDFMIKCVCGRTYHRSCVSQLRRCKNCNKEIFHPGI